MKDYYCPLDLNPTSHFSTLDFATLLAVQTQQNDFFVGKIFKCVYSCFFALVSPRSFMSNKTDNITRRTPTRLLDCHQYIQGEEVSKTRMELNVTELICYLSYFGKRQFSRSILSLLHVVLRKEQLYLRITCLLGKED